jgi:hypothetical protein
MRSSPSIPVTMPQCSRYGVALTLIAPVAFVLAVDVFGFQQPQPPSAMPAPGQVPVPGQVPAPSGQPGGASQTSGSSTPCTAVMRSTVDNGIGVSDPKIFDNRSLALMLDSLSESLRTAQFIDAKSLAASLSAFQGSQQESVARSFSLQGPSLPGVVDTAKDTTTTGSTITSGTSGTTVVGATGSQDSTVNTTGSQNQVTGTTTSTKSGTTSTDTSNANTSNTATSGGTTERTTQTTTAARTPVNPELPTLLAAPNFTPQFGTSANDLLSDQVNLTYQIFNLRMLLERALSDRLMGDSPRLQAVLGFNVTLDPNRDWRDSAAFVEVTLSMRNTASRPISVVALMPQEKTYNSAALSNKSNAFGGSAVSQLISIGYSERRQSQLFYLYRDNDTIAFHRTNGAPTETRLGWSFRPVLGRRSVSPGMRQMFAVISLPAADIGMANVPIDVDVKTYWRSYDRKTLTTADANKTASTAAYMSGCVEVPTTAEFQNRLDPEITGIRWRMTDDKNAFVTVEGSNFFQGTSVRLGGSAYATPADGFTLKSDKAFDLAVPISALLGDGSIVGRYGVAEEMLAPTVSAGGMEIEQVTWSPAVGGRTQLTIDLKGRTGTLDRSTMPLPLVVSLNGAVIPPPYDLSDSGRRLRAYVPMSQFSDVQGMLTVLFPFAGERWRDTWRIYDSSQAFTVTRFAATPAAQTTPSTTKLLIGTSDTANGFQCTNTSNTWTVILDTAYAAPPGLMTQTQPGAVAVSGDLMQFLAPSDALDKHALLLRDCHGAAYKLAVPAATPKPEKTVVATVAPQTVKVNDARKITISGKLLDRVTSVTANGLDLESHAASDGTTLDVFLVRRLTQHAATITLVCRDKKDDILGSVDIVVQ